MIFDKVKRFLLTLDCPEPDSQPIFSSGDTVTGRVLLELVGEAKVDSIKLHAQGLARVQWSESHSTNSNAAYNQNHSDEVVYLDHQEALLQTEDEAPAVLQPGTHEFPFSFELPEDAVTSFEGKLGSVHYWVKAKLHRPWATVKKAKVDFTVLQPIDINTPALLAPQRGTKEKKAHTWYCSLGQVSLTTKIDRKGYTPGDDIVIFADIDNGTSKAVVPKVAIIQTQTYATRGITKQKEAMVASFTGDSVVPRKKETWHGKSLKVPPLCPSITQCRIIRVEYALKVCIEIPSASVLCLQLPLVIGTVPLYPFGSRSPSINGQYAVNLEWLRMTIPEQPEPPPEYTDIVFHGDCEYGMSPPLNRDFNGVLEGPFYTYIQEFRNRPPPLYSEVDPHPVDILSSAS
ncbi:arrestin domain-containing protein 2-like [Pleurodeles waltl]|uniref:arrestin domain-containing protein 2-like n=1 Tax=Pleurodeles waltl TaxID=8319 RepID=UPI0037093D36